MKSSKGISLIVLVITIIVMIVLAGAIILTLNNSGIIGRASDAVEETNYTIVKELAQMAWAEAYANGAREIEGDHGLKAAVDQALIDNNVDTEKYGIAVTTSGVKVVNGWIQDGLTVKKGKTVLTIGDDFEYDETGEGTKDVAWKVLGASDKGELLIMSSTDIVSSYRFGYEDSMTDGAVRLEECQNDWLTGKNQLNDECERYKYGERATGARSITIEDVNKITGYDKTTYGKKEIYEYGNEVTYSYNGTTTPSYTSTNGLRNTLTGTHSNGFYYYNGTGFVVADLSISTGIITTLKNDVHGYYTTKLETIDKTSKAYTMLFGKYENENTKYWLASPSVYTGNDRAYFGMYWVALGKVNGYGLWGTNGACYSDEAGIRAVVSLASDIQVTVDSENGWTY